MEDAFGSELFNKVYGALAGGAIGDAMAGVTEMMHYETIERLFGEVESLLDHRTDPSEARFTQGDPAGTYTDDTRLKHIFCRALLLAGDRITSDEFGNAWREVMHGWFFTPVVSSYYKMFQQGVRPRDAGLGNMSSNSTAMAIAPVGIVNACQPREAARDAYDVASVVHRGYARDGAAAIAAAVASAFIPGIEVGEVVSHAMAHLDKSSEMTPLIEAAIELADETAEYKEFRRRFYETSLIDWPQTDLSGPPSPDGFYDTAEPREAVPTVLALFKLANGDPRTAVIYAANFGRDCDTIGSMVGGISGAYMGIGALPEEWVETVNAVNDTNQHELAQQMTELVLAVNDSRRSVTEVIDDLKERVEE